MYLSLTEDEEAQTNSHDGLRDAWTHGHQAVKKHTQDTRNMTKTPGESYLIKDILAFPTIRKGEPGSRPSVRPLLLINSQLAA